MYQLYIYVLFEVLVVVLLKACRAFYMLGKQSTSGLQPHAPSSHCSVITPSHVHGMHSGPHLPPHFYVQFSHSFRPGLWHSCTIQFPRKLPSHIGLRNRAINITVTLTEITGEAVVQVPIKFCPVCFFQACAKAKVRKFHMALVRGKRR